jgi:transposase-like protein
MDKKPKIKPAQFNLHGFHQRFPDEKSCRDYLKKARFPDGNIVCPKCATFDKIYELKDGKRYKCGNCKHIFTITVGTIFEASHISLHKWFLAIYIVSAHKKGISSLQLHRDLGVTQKTAWFILHRIRYMLAHGDSKRILSGTVEADETYIKNTGKEFKNRGREVGGTTPVIGIVERGGEVRTFPVKSATRKELEGNLLKHVEKTAHVMTDQHSGYNYIGYHFKNHETVNHGTKEYVRGNVHTNTIEGFWSLLKRGIIGIYHYVSPKHIHRYCGEYQYRYNTRKIEDGDRFFNSLKTTETRLKYSTLIQKVK